MYVEVEVPFWCCQGQKLTWLLPRRKTYTGVYNEDEETPHVKEDGILRY